MQPTVSELLAAMPGDQEVVDEHSKPRQFEELIAGLSRKSVPTGALRRLWSLSGMQAKIGLAYMVYGVRSLFRDSDAKQNALLDAHLASAVKLLETMGYLRGAVMKIGQTAANFPDLVPDEFVETLGKLHFEAPPMHYSLLREYVRNELGDDPEEIFEQFDTTAIAAASLGQVHRARLKTGEEVAVKIQYPGIARTIRSDFRNLSALFAPLRLSKDWENMKSQFEEVRRIIEQETDYEQEAEFLRKGRALFREEEGIVIPKVYDAFSTRRVLTMEYLDGKNFYQFLGDNPSQDVRNHYGSLITRAHGRMIYSGRMQYADPHPGNYLFLDDNRLGIVDFGCMRAYDADDWEYLRLADAAILGSRQILEEHILRGTDFTEEETAGTEFMDLMVDYCRWLWEPFSQEGPFDYSDPELMRRGIEIIRKFSKLARPRQKPVNVFIQRSMWAGWGVMYRLRAQVDVKSICDEEARVTGWR